MLGRDHVPSFGNIRAEVMIIGQSPGKKEVERCEPFVGHSGALLDMMLENAELDREEVYIANVLKCHPPDNRPGSDKEIYNCYNTWLKHEIAKLNPKLLILLGRDAFKALSIPNKFWKHGQSFKSQKRRYLVSYHPAYFLRQNDLESFVQVGAKVRQILEYEDNSN